MKLGNEAVQHVAKEHDGLNEIHDEASVAAWPSDKEIAAGCGRERINAFFLPLR